MQEEWTECSHFQSAVLYSKAGGDVCPIYPFVLKKQLPNSMEQRPSWEAYKSSASQEIPRILWNCIDKSTPPVLILSQIDPVHAPILRFEDLFQYYPPI